MKPQTHFGAESDDVGYSYDLYIGENNKDISEKWFGYMIEGLLLGPKSQFKFKKVNLDTELQKFLDNPDITVSKLYNLENNELLEKLEKMFEKSEYVIDIITQGMNFKAVERYLKGGGVNVVQYKSKEDCIPRGLYSVSHCAEIQ